MIKLKRGVSLRGIQPQISVILIMANDAYTSLGFDCTVTSVTDGKHGRASLHNIGHAVDFRTMGIPKNTVNRIARMMRTALGKEFDIVREKDHIHVEYQPK